MHIQLHVYRYTYVLNNPLKYTDPSGYLYSNKRIEWENSWSEGQDMYYSMMQINADWMDRMRRRGGGGGGYSYGDRISALGGDPRGWNYNPYTNQYENSRTGESINASDQDVINSMGIEHERYLIYETAYLCDGKWHGTGKYKVIKEGIMVSTGMFPTYISERQSNTYINLLSQNGKDAMEDGKLSDYLSNKQLWNYGYDMAYHGAFQLAYNKGQKDARDKTPFKYPGLGSSYPKEIRRAFWKYFAADAYSAGVKSGIKDGEYFGYVLGFQEQWYDLPLNQRGEYDPISPVLPKWYELFRPFPVSE